MTNGEKMQAVFPDIEMWGESKDTLDYSLGGMIHRVTKSWWNAEYKELTNKNDLRIAYISRKSVIDELKRYFHDEYYQRTSIQDCRDCFIEDVLIHLPSVTLQEPRKGEWLRMSDLSEQEDDRYKCSRCGNVIHHKNKMDLYTFNSWCGRCGSNNGR